MLHLLTQLGLDDTEARVYLALLEIGSSTVTEITNHAEITRTLGYHVLEKLESYEIVSSVSPSTPAGRRETSGKKRYTAEHPDKLIHYVEDKKRQWERNLTQAKQHLPDFLKIYGEEKEHDLIYTEGQEAIESVSRETLSATVPIFAIVKGIEDDKSIDYCAQKNDSKILYIEEKNTSVSRETHEKRKNARNIRHISAQKLPNLENFTGKILIFDKVVHMLSHNGDKYVGITIKSLLVVTLMQSLFDLAWNSAGEHSTPLQNSLL